MWALVDWDTKVDVSAGMLAAARLQSLLDSRTEQPDLAPYGNALADPLQPDLRVIVDMGYGSGEYANLPTPASLFELPNPFHIVPDLATGAVQGAAAFGVDMGWLPASDYPTGYPFRPVLDPGLNYPIPQTPVTGLSLLIGFEGQLMNTLGLVPPWDS
jgi:hypothetical protein